MMCLTLIPLSRMCSNYMNHELRSSVSRRTWFSAQCRKMKRWATKSRNIYTKNAKFIH